MKKLTICALVVLCVATATDKDAEFDYEIVPNSAFCFKK